MTFIGIDVGTFETKGVLVDADGRTLAMARKRHGISTPCPGHVEQDPWADWWADVTFVASELMQNDAARDVSAVAVSAIGPCVVAVDGDLNPLRPAILYGIDTRATDQIIELVERLGSEEIVRRSGNPLTSQSAGPKIAWIRDEEPDVWVRTRWFMTSQSWLVAQLTGEVTIDHATAGYFHPIYDIEQQRWDTSGCESFVRVEQLPRIEWSSAIAGRVHRQAAEQTGIPEGTPVMVGTTDAPAEAVAAGVVADGTLMAMYGSSGYFIRVGSSLITSDRLWAAPFVFEGTYVLAAGTVALGTATRWISDVLSITDPDDTVTFTRLLDLAHQSPPGSRGLLAMPHFSGERTPFQDPRSRAAIVGLGLEHNRSDIARAVLEGAGHAVSEAILTYEREGVRVDRIVSIGGATQNDVIMETVSTVTGLTQEVASTPGASYGDAFLAAYGTGVIPDLASGGAWWSSGKSVAPVTSAQSQLQSDHEAYLALYEALAPWNSARSRTGDEDSA